MKKFIFFLSCLSVTPTAWAAEALSLKESVARALVHAPALQAAQAARDAAQESVVLGQAQLLPYVAGTASLTRRNQDFSYDRPAAFLRPTVRNNERSYGIQASQPLFDLSKWANYKQGQLLAASSELQLDLQRQKTILQAAAAWLDVTRAQATLDAAKSSEQTMQKLARQAKVSFEIGISSVNESLAAQSRHDLATSQRIRAQQGLLQAQAQLDSLLGQKTDVIVHIKPHTAPLQLEPQKLEDWQQRAEAHALGIKLNEQAVSMADNNHLQALGSAMPTVQLVAGWNKTTASDGSFGGSTVKTTAIGIELNAPFYAGGALSAKRRQAIQEKVKAEYNVAETKRTVRLAIQQAWLGLQTTTAEIASLDSALNSAKSAKKATEAGFEVGLRNITDVMDANDRLLTAKQAYADAIARHAMAFLQLHATAGEVSSHDMEAIDRLMR